MKNTQYSGGTEGAKNPSTQNNGSVKTADNGFFEKSLYVAAISQFVGCEGLASPATDVRDGVKYTFDFYHAECGKVFKIFKGDDLSEYEKYAQYPGDVAILVDVGGYPDCQAGECACCGERYLILPCELGEKLHDTDDTYVFLRGLLCEYARDAKDGKSHWRVLDPIALRETEEDDEFDGEEDAD